MKNFTEFVNENSNAINEADDDFVRKGIFTEQGKKVMGERPGWLTLNAVRKDDTLKQLNWKQFKASKLPFSPATSMTEAFIKGLLGTIKDFGRKVDYNMWVKTGSGANATFEEKVDKIMSLGAKLTKKGVKA